MKLKDIFIVAVVLSALVISLVALNFANEAKMLANPSVEKDETSIAGDFFVLENHKYNTATTTVEYLIAAGDAITEEFYTGDADLLDMNLAVVASSTSAVLSWEFEYSDNYIDWYQESGSQVDSITAVSYGATGLVHSWTPGTTSESLRNFSMSPVAAKYTRVTFSASTANLSLWYNIINRRTQ